MLATIKQTAELVEFFRKNGDRYSWEKGDVIINPGEAPPGVFYIYKGVVKAYDITRYGNENLLIIRKEHEVFPLIWALTGQERQVIYKALAPTITWRVNRDDFTKFIINNTEAILPLMDITLEMYRLHSERLLNLEYRTVRERLISFLLTMSERFGQMTKQGLLVDVTLRHQDIASSINASRETTSREISALERKGLIKSKSSRFLLKDVAALEAFLSR